MCARNLTGSHFFRIKKKAQNKKREARTGDVTPEAKGKKKEEKKKRFPMSGEVGLRYVCLPKRTGTVRLRQLHWAQRKACLSNWRLLRRAPTLFAFLSLSLSRIFQKTLL